MKLPNQPSDLIGYIILVAVLAGCIIAFMGIFDHAKICDRCGERIIGKGNNVFDIYVCDRCFSEANHYAGRTYGDKYCPERAVMVYGLLKTGDGTLTALNDFYEQEGKYENSGK